LYGLSEDGGFDDVEDSLNFGVPLSCVAVG